MFESWLQLEQRPFGTAPFAAYYYAAEEIEQARSSIHRCIERGTGPAVVIGAAGTGKTMLAMVLQHEVCSLTPFALVSGGELHSRRELFQSLLYEYGLPFRGEPETELRLALLDFVTSRDASQLASVLVVDDADCLTPELLQDLASLSNHARDGNWCLQLVLLGTGRLEEILASPALASLQQRIACRCHLGNWTLSETVTYILGQVASLREKWDRFPDFPEDTCRKIYEITSGTPRLVNQLCEHLLMAVVVTGERVVTAEEAERAWYDLQQLPAPTCAGRLSAASDPAQAAGVNDLIEFGELSDDAPEPLSPGCVGDIHSKLEQLEDGLNLMVAGEAATGPSCQWSVVSANSVSNNPFAEKFEVEVIIDHHQEHKMMPEQQLNQPVRKADMTQTAAPNSKSSTTETNGALSSRRYRHLFSRLVQGV
jgi:type II secretory pathway predicted ATPase ExeA